MDVYHVRDQLCPAYGDPSLPQKDCRVREAFSKWVPLEVGRNLRWNSDKIMRLADHKKKPSIGSAFPKKASQLAHYSKSSHFIIPSDSLIGLR
jgi:hypothetical protein